MLSFNRGKPRLVIIVLVAVGLALVTTTEAFAQAFRITSIETTNNDVRITWNAPAGSNYVVQTTAPIGQSNFIDLGPIIAIPGPGIISTNFTDQNALLNSTLRFYRVRSYPIPPILSIYPTNAVIGLNMTNRYQVFLKNPDNSVQDVTASAVIGISNNIAQTVGLSNGFALVRGTNLGTGFVQATHQGITTSVPLTVAQLTKIFTVPPLSQINDYVNGDSNSVQVFGIFSNGKTNNITPSSSLQSSSGGSPVGTRIDYRVQPDVADAYALISGQSAAAETLMFAGGGTNSTNFLVTWCWFKSITVQPQSVQLFVGQQQQFDIIGHMADGTSVDVLNYITSGQLSFIPDDDIVSVDSFTQTATGEFPGSTIIHVNAYNGPGDFCIDGLDSDVSVTVVTPPSITSPPGYQLVAPGSNAAFTVVASGTLPLVYQWQSNGVNIASATNASLILTNCSVAQEGFYRVIITNAFGSVTSSVAALTVAAISTPSWTNTYNGPGGADDEAYALTLDPGGNVIVTGYSTGAAGNYDYKTIKYSSAGARLWTNTFNGSFSSDDVPQAITADSSSNVFVTGSSIVSNGTPDWMTIKYSGAGVPLWTNRYNGPGNNYDTPSAISHDSSGNVFVAGFGTVSNLTGDYVTIKYSNAGVPLWTNRYNGPSNNYDSASGLVVDSSGNVIVTGSSTGTNGNYDLATIKYSNTGTPSWTNRYNGPGNGDDLNAVIAVDPGGNVVVAGQSPGLSGFGGYVAIRYSSIGTPLWTNRFDVSNNVALSGAIATDLSSNVFVTGSVTLADNTTDYLTIKYSPSGLPLWTNRYNGPANGNDTGQAIAVDSGGNAVVTGYPDLATIKYSSSGAVTWFSRYNGGVGRAIGIATNGSVFITGSGLGLSGDIDFLTVRYAP